MIGNNAACYQGIQRVFRNAIVGFLRENLPRIFPKDHIQQLKRLFGEAWDKAASDASRSRAIGGTTTAIQDDYDLLGVNHFYEVFDKHFDRLFSVAAGYPASRPRPVKSKLLGNLKSIKDGRDPLSHPVDDDIPYDEAVGLLVDAKQVLRTLGLRYNQKVWKSEAGGVSSWVTKPTGRRPSLRKETPPWSRRPQCSHRRQVPCGNAWGPSCGSRSNGSSTRCWKKR